MRMSLLLASIGAFLLTVPLITAEEKLPPELKETAYQHALHLEKAEEPILKLQQKYENVLLRLRDESQASGDLDSVLEIGQELKSFRNRTEPLSESAKNVKLREMQSIYQKEMKELERSADVNRQVALQKYAEDVERLTVELTKNGDIEKAVHLRTIAVSIQSEIDLLTLRHQSIHPDDAAAEEDAIIVLKGKEENYVASGVLPLSVKQVRNGHELWSKGNATKVLSKEAVQTPFRILAKAKTDSNEIRIYFGLKGSVRLNRSATDYSVEFIEPISGANHTSDQKGGGELIPNRMHDLEVQVTRTKIAVLIDGRKRAEISGSFGDVEGPFGLGPAIGSIVNVEYLKGIQD